MLDSAFIALLACPKCESRPPLRQDSETALVCTVCASEFPIEEGIPNLLVEQSDPPTTTEPAQP